MTKSRVKRATKKKPLAVPAILPGMRGGASWHVREVKEGETPHTLNKRGSEGEMAIPMDGSPRSEFIKLHELLHAAHSPVEEPRDIIGPDHEILYVKSLMLAEELRINLLGRVYVGADNMPDMSEESLETMKRLVEGYFSTGNPGILMDVMDYILLTWTLGTKRLTAHVPEVSKLVDWLWTLRDVNPTLAYEVRDFLDLHTVLLEGLYTVWGDDFDDLFAEGTTPPWESVIRVAAYLQEQFKSLESIASAIGQPGKQNPSDSSEDPDLQDFRERFYLDDVDNDHKPNKKKEPTTPRELRKRLWDQIDKAKGDTPDQPREEAEPLWGQMKTRVARLTKSLPKKLISKQKYRATDEGAVPRYVHRLPIDGKIFGRKKKSPGGSVLIDDSGSMGWATSDLEAIMTAAPAVNIAAYSGEWNSGELVIVGKDGKYADVSEPGNRPKGNNNLVDLPALEWLADQPKPRIWVSDTYVTIRGGSIDIAYEQVYRICKQKDINIVPDAKAAREVFEGKREIYR